MTENEAKKLIEKFCEDRMNFARGKDMSDKELEDFCKFSDALTLSISSLEEIQQYRTIGTVEECREARERQKGKKPILCMNEVGGMFIDYADGHGEYKTQTNNWFRCPCCNEVVGQRIIVHKRIHDQRKKKFCEKCGQAISWESDTP